MTTYANKPSVYKIKCKTKKELDKILEELDKPTLTKDFLKECMEVYDKLTKPNQYSYK